MNSRLKALLVAVAPIVFLTIILSTGPAAASNQPATIQQGAPVHALQTNVTSTTTATNSGSVSVTPFIFDGQLQPCTKYTMTALRHPTKVNPTQYFTNLLANSEAPNNAISSSSVS